MRKATISRLRPEKREQYLNMHRNPWPEVCKIMSEHHHTNHTVFLYGDYLFQYFEYTGENFDDDMAEMRKSPVMQEWWQLCRECVIPFDENTELTWTPLEELFRND